MSGATAGLTPAGTSSTDPTAASESADSDERAERSASAGAPMTFDPYGTDHLSNLADEHNQATPDPGDG